MVYLDNAASSFPKPTSVANAMNKAVSIFGANPGRSGHFLSMFAAGEIYQCREKANALFNGTGPENVIFTQNATHALNIAIQGALRPGAHVIISDLEHNSVVRPIKHLEPIGVYYTVIKTSFTNDDETVTAFKNAIRKDTAMIVCTLASNVFGKIMPIDRISKLAKQYGIILVVDGAQGAGAIEIDVIKQQIDLLCLAGHKGLYGPQGTGMLLIGNPEIELRPLTFGGTGTNSLDYVQPTLSPERYESGTVNTPGICGLYEGMNFVSTVGIKNIKYKEHNMLLYLYDELKKIPNVILYHQRPTEDYVAVLSFNIKNNHSNEFAAYLDSKGIMVRSGLHCSPLAHIKTDTVAQGTVRASISYFNSIGDIDKLVYAIKKHI